MTTLPATTPRAGYQVSELLQIICGEYREMPCLSLTKAQMQRLWGLEALVCDALIDALVAARVLRRTESGAYVAAHPAPDGPPLSRSLARTDGGRR